MLPILLVFVTSAFCQSSGVLEQKARLDSIATLSCPHTTGDIIWSRFLKSEKVILVTIKNGEEQKSDDRYGSRNGDLVIKKVKQSDETLYLCNGKPMVYLKVTTDPSEVSPKGQPEDESAVAAGRDSVNVDLGPDLIDAAPKIQQPSDWWKIPVGLVTGASVVLLVMFIIWLAKKGKRTRSSEQPISEVVYEEIKDTSIPPQRDSGVESPNYWSAIVEAPNTSGPASQNLYSTVNKLRPDQECVYFLAQNQGVFLESPAASS